MCYEIMLKFNCITRLGAKMVTTTVEVNTSPRYVIESFCQVYRDVNNGREACVRYMGNQWYYVNGETVHRAMLMDETERLRSLMPPPPPIKRTPQDRSMIQRLIARLKGL